MKLRSQQGGPRSQDRGSGLPPAEVREPMGLQQGRSMRGGRELGAELTVKLGQDGPGFEQQGPQGSEAAAVGSQGDQL